MNSKKYFTLIYKKCTSKYPSLARTFNTKGINTNTILNTHTKKNEKQKQQKQTDTQIELSGRGSC